MCDAWNLFVWFWTWKWFFPTELLFFICFSILSQVLWDPFTGDYCFCPFKPMMSMHEKQSLHNTCKGINFGCEFTRKMVSSLFHSVFLWQTMPLLEGKALISRMMVDQMRLGFVNHIMEQFAVNSSRIWAFSLSLEWVRTRLKGKSKRPSL